MAGHSKWHNIQHRKGRQDARRGKIFTKLIREITVAAQLGDADPANNPRLRAAIDKALGSNMTKDTIMRAVKRGSGGDGANNLESIRYEGYGPSGVAVMVDCLTDNKNRSVAEVRHAFTKCGGNLGTDGSVAYLFTLNGILSFEAGVDEDKLMETALEAGADDITNNSDNSIDILTSAEAFETVKSTLENAGLNPQTAEVTMLASTEALIDNPDQAAKLLRLNEMLEDLDDVQNVYTNANIPDDVLAKLD
ncbi:MAG: YebC/PmpR family DNA-binding transcriptional regulator [Gammaproteobacteria bacterium]|nr:YebC/PmpR family DNA-binding transcriptional regulator [Gammaproteobacteria bacterium]